MVMMIMPCDIHYLEVQRLAASNEPNKAGLVSITNGEGRASF
jgi:hypothetical protein